MLWRVLPKLWPWCIRAPVIWLESILSGVLMYHTWPCALGSSYTSSSWASMARGHGLHLRWWCSLSWNSLPNMLISHSPSVRLWLSYLLWEAIYALKRLVVPYPVLPWQFALLYNCSDGSHLLVAVFRCTAGRGLHSEKGGVVILSFDPEVSLHLPIVANRCFWYLQAWDKKEGREARGAGKVFLDGFYHGDHILGS